MMMMLAPPVDVPPMPYRHAADIRRRFNGISGRRAGQPIEEGLPGLTRLLGVEVEENHADLERVIRRKVYLLAPMIVKEGFAVKGDELPDQAAERVIGVCFDGEVGAARKLGEF